MIIDHQPNTRDLHTVPNTTIPYCGGGMTIHKGSDPGILYSLYIGMQDHAHHSKPQGQCNVFFACESIFTSISLLETLPCLGLKPGQECLPDPQREQWLKLKVLGSL